MFKGKWINRLMSWLLLSGLMTGMTPLRAQDIDFSQFFNNPTYFNPAYVGLTPGLKVRMNYQRQWVGLSGNYHAYDFSADIADRNIPGAGGIGIIATQDQQGLGMLKSSMIGILPSVRIPVNNFSIFQLGAMVAVVNRQFDWNNLVFSDQLDPRLGNIDPSAFTNPGAGPVVFPDFSLGGIYQLKLNHITGTFGFAVHHITEPNQSFLENVAPLPRKYVAHMDFIIDFERNRGFYSRARNIKLNPGVFYQTQAKMRLLAVGSNAYVSNVYAGVWYQNEVFKTGSLSNLVWLVGLNVPFDNNSRMKVMYSYNMNLSGTSGFPGASHEISLIFELDNVVLINPVRFRNTSRSRNALECSPF